MRTDGTNHLRRAKSMKIGFLSGVTKPAHEGANALVLKSHSEPPTVALLKSTFSAALAEKELEQKVRDFLSNSWMLNDALYEAAEDIAKDDSITDKQAALRDAVNEYIITLQQAAGISMNKAKGGKTEDGKVFPASDYAYVPDPEKPSTWKLRLTATPGGEPDARIVGAALAALGPGYRGNKVEIPEADLAGVKNKVRSAWENEKDVASEVATAEPTATTEVPQKTANAPATTEENPLAYRKRKRRLGDRREGRRLRTIQPVLQLMPYVMPKRCDALNTFYDRLEISRVDDLCRRKVREGKIHFSALHVLLAAYLRTISQRPGINRFVSGQKIFARNEIVFVMTVKKELSLNAPETLIKVKFNPSDTLDEVYEKFNATAQAAIASMDHPTAFDNLCGGLSKLPGLLLRFLMWVLRVLDYIGHLPKAFLEVSP